MTADMFAEQDKRFGTVFGQQVVIQGEQGPKGDKGDKGDTGEPGPAGPAGADATVTTESIKDALGYTPGDDSAMAGKLTEPSTGLAVGKYFRIAAIDENGHAVLEAVDANVGGLSTEPSLWPAWTSDEQAAARERLGIEDLGAWEDIVTVTTDESTSFMTVDKDSNGSPFSLCQVICELIMPAESVSKSRSVYYGTGENVLVAFTRVQAFTNTTVRSFSLAYAKIVSGKIICESAISASLPNSYQECTNKSIYNGYAYQSAESFDTISAFTYSDAFPAGCTLKIRGIRI